MTRTFKKMGKIVAVSAGIVLMGAIFSGCGFMESMFGGDSTSAQSSSSASSGSKNSDSGVVSSFLGGLFGGSEQDNKNREKCSGDEEKNENGIIVAKGKCTITGKEECMIDDNGFFHKGKCNIGIKEGLWKHYDNSGIVVLKEISYKKGLLNGISKIYDKDENLIKELPYKDGKLNGTVISYDKETLDNFTKMTTDYVDGKEKFSRIYYYDSIASIQQTQINGNMILSRIYNILDESSKELEKILLPKLKAKYEKPLNEAIKNDKKLNSDSWECLVAISAVEKYNKYETRIAPSAQTIKKAQECSKTQSSIVAGFNLLAGGIETQTLKKQIEKEYDDAIFAEFKKNGYKFNDDNKILAYIKDKYPINETIVLGTLKMVTDTEMQGFLWNEIEVVTTKLFWYDKNSWDFDKWINIGTINHNTQNTQNACVAKNGGNCRAFSRQFKELIDKSLFKDKIYNLLPKPKNQ